jgi:DNA-binding transcriptional LysR family regulator
MSIDDHLEFRLLKYIVAIAEAGTFTAAAARLHVSQSALSTQIRTLEDVLGIRVFDREHRTTLTRAGKVLLRYGKEGLKTRKHIVQTIQAIHAGRMTHLRLGFTPFVHKSTLRSVSEIYKELIPDSGIIPESGDNEELTNRIRQDDLDVALLTLPIASDDLQINVLERERMVVCMRADDPLADYDEVPAAALNEKVSIFTYQRHHPAAYAQLMEMFNEIGVTLRPCRPTMNIDHIQWMVREGICYSVIQAGRPLVNGLVTRPIAGVDWTFDTALVAKVEHSNSALSLLIEEVAKHFRQPAGMSEKRPVASVGVHKPARRAGNSPNDHQLGLFGIESE